MRCKKCGRKLLDKESIKRGYGPVCWEEHTGSIKRSDDSMEGQICIEDIMQNQKEVDIN